MRMTNDEKGVKQFPLGLKDWDNCGQGSSLYLLSICFLSAGKLRTPTVLFSFIFHYHSPQYCKLRELIQLMSATAEI